MEVRKSGGAEVWKCGRVEARKSRGAEVGSVEVRKCALVVIILILSGF